jgi:hypothetical protein
MILIKRATILVSLTLCLHPGLSVSAPHVPADDGAVLERLPSRPTDPNQRELRRLRAASAANPQDPAPAVALARRNFELAMSEGDPRYIGYGEAALAPWREQSRAPIDVLIVKAQLAQYRHEFGRATEYLDRALAIEPLEPEALAWRAAIHMVQADYGAARTDCAKLAQIATKLLATGCEAYVDAMTGATQAAYARLLGELTRNPHARPTLKLWTLTLLADMAHRSGNDIAAEGHYHAAFALGLTDQYLLAAYAEFLLDLGRAKEVVALLSPWERSDGLLLLLATAERVLGRPEAAGHARTLQERYEASARRGERLHVQDEARFRLEFLHDAQGALDLAVENWSHQKEPRDAQLLLEAAAAAHQPAAAQPVLAWLTASGFQDPKLRRLAADIAEQAR